MDMCVVGDLFANIRPWLQLWRRRHTVGLFVSGCLPLWLQRRCWHCLRLLLIELQTQGTASIVATCYHRKPVKNQIEC
jgi:hypothetical protein